jgi:hypothetical protein
MCKRPWQWEEQLQFFCTRGDAVETGVCGVSRRLGLFYDLHVKWVSSRDANRQPWCSHQVIQMKQLSFVCCPRSEEGEATVGLHASGLIEGGRPQKRQPSSGGG